MKIIKDVKFHRQLFGILLYIAKDKKSAAKRFEKALESKIQGLADFPFRCRKSIYFDDEAYRDLIYKGFTIIYKVEIEQILILEIFKWQDR